MDVKRNLLPLTGKATASLRVILLTQGGGGREREGEGDSKRAEQSKEWGRGCLSAEAAGLR